MWLDLARGGTYLHPEAIRPRALEPSLVDDFFSSSVGQWERAPTDVTLQVFLKFRACYFQSHSGGRPL
jgi:hypothetical protein